MAPEPDARLLPTNRKYLGSKRHLAAHICDRICVHGAPESFLDGFCGTGAVAIEVARRGSGPITCVDNLLSNTAVLSAYFSSVVGGASDAVARWLERLGRTRPRHGYVARSFGGRYFTHDNARRIDGVRSALDRPPWRRDGGDQPHEDIRAALLAALLLGADRVANCIGQYDAYLKHLGSSSHRDGRHLVDSRVYSRLRLVPLATAPADATVVTADIADVLDGASVRGGPTEVAYFDPPYNARQYSDNYHVLEAIARWDGAEVHGKTRKARRPGLRSAFSRRSQVAEALAALVSACRAKRIYLSYSSEGLLSADQVWALLRQRGAVERWAFDHPVFGHGAGVARKRRVTEYLYELRPRAA